MKYWICLITAGLLEAVWVVGMKYTQGFTRLIPSVVTLGIMGISFYLLSYSMKAIPLGNAYAIWTSIGIVAGAIAGMFLFGEDKSVLKLICIGLILTGIIGLKLSSKN
ncbi:quaternary ammonium compound efflux SMR transporter SugE [bacterium]|nr:quaternary ammonium compound efflux SMR transporter SugE [bacterium]